MAQVDTSIFNAIGRGVKSVADYQAEANALESQKMQNLLGRQQLQAAQQGQQDDAAMRALYAKPGFDPSSPDALPAIGAVSPKAYGAAQAAQLAARKTNADIGETGVKTDAAKFKLMQEKRDKAMSDIAAFQTPDEAKASLSAHIQAGDIDPQRGNMIMQSIPQNPADFTKWQLNMLTGILSPKDRLEATKPDIKYTPAGGSLVPIQSNAYAGPTGPMQGVAPIPITQSADSVASNATQQRGQNMVDNRARELNTATAGIGKITPGYRAKPDGSWEAIPGGPADLKLQGALNADTQALSGSTASLDRLGAAANEALNAPGLKGIFGMQGVLPNAPGGDAANAAALLNTLKSQVGFGVLQDMRNNSKTGGALGAVSDKENQMLQSNLAALDKAQSFDQAKASLKKIVDYAEAAKQRMRAAYNLKHGDAGGANGIPPEVAAALAKHGVK